MLDLLEIPTHGVLVGQTSAGALLKFLLLNILGWAFKQAHRGKDSYWAESQGKGRYPPFGPTSHFNWNQIHGIRNTALLSFPFFSFTVWIGCPA